MSARHPSPGRAALPPAARPEVAIWQEVEWGSYAADLPVWEELAPPGTSVLELGCGTGRVALHLARRGAEVWAADLDARLLDDLASRARDEGLRVDIVEADARRLRLRRRFDLVLAPLQLLNLLDPADQRLALSAARAHLEPGSRFAAAVVLPRMLIGGAAVDAPLPDVREISGCVYSSLPDAVTWTEEGGAVELRRLRAVVSPGGELREEIHVERLYLRPAEAIEAEAREAGLRPVERRVLAAEGDVAASTVLVFGATGPAARDEDRVR